MRVRCRGRSRIRCVYYIIILADVGFFRENRWHDHNDIITSCHTSRYYYYDALCRPWKDRSTDRPPPMARRSPTNVRGLFFLFFFGRHSSWRGSNGNHSEIRQHPLSCGCSSCYVIYYHLYDHTGREQARLRCGINSVLHLICVLSKYNLFFTVETSKKRARRTSDKSK